LKPYISTTPDVLPFAKGIQQENCYAGASRGPNDNNKTVDGGCFHLGAVGEYWKASSVGPAAAAAAVQVAIIRRDTDVAVVRLIRLSEWSDVCVHRTSQDRPFFCPFAGTVTRSQIRGALVMHPRRMRNFPFSVTYTFSVISFLMCRISL